MLHVVFRIPAFGFVFVWLCLYWYVCLLVVGLTWFGCFDWLANFVCDWFCVVCYLWLFVWVVLFCGCLVLRVCV